MFRVSIVHGVQQTSLLLLCTQLDFDDPRGGTHPLWRQQKHIAPNYEAASKTKNIQQAGFPDGHPL
jgi:hypothetical protein